MKKKIKINTPKGRLTAQISGKLNPTIFINIEVKKGGKTIEIPLADIGFVNCTNKIEMFVADDSNDYNTNSIMVFDIDKMKANK